MATGETVDLPPGFKLDDDVPSTDLPPGFVVVDDDNRLPVPQGTAPPAPPESIERPTIDASAPPPQISGDQAEMLGWGQGAFGMGDEISAGMRAVKDTAMTPERRWGDLLQLYRAYKGNAARDLALAEKQQPLRSTLGQLQGALVTGIATTPSAVNQISNPLARFAANTGVNTAQAIANNYGRDTLTPGHVIDDVGTGMLVQGLASAGQYALRSGFRGMAGDAMQLPKKVGDASSNVLGKTVGGFVSPEIKTLKTAQQSYLTEAGKQGAAAQAAMSGDDFASRLAKAASEGRAEIGPGQNFGVNPAEFGDDLQKIMDEAYTEGIASNPIAAKVAERPEFNKFEDVLHQISASPDVGQAAGTVRRGGGGSAGANVAREVGNEIKRIHMEKLSGAMSDAQSVLDRWRAAKAAQGLAQSRADAIAPELAKTQQGIGRDMLERIVGRAVGGAAGSIMGPLGMATGTAAGGKTLGKATLGAIDRLGEFGAKFGDVASLAEQLATEDTVIGKAAKWALSADGPALAARLATLAKMPEVQAELQKQQTE